MAVGDTIDLSGLKMGKGAPIHYDRFSPRVRAQLGRYVYRLVDPRNGETFYVGRGVNNRVFDHMDEAASGKRSKKTDRINEIHRDGWRVGTVIHRHSLEDADETNTLEAAMIQAYPRLTNQVAGEGTSEFGAQRTDDLIRKYDDPPAQLGDHKCLMLSVTKAWPLEDDDEPTSWTDLYARTRHGWALELKKAQKAEYIVTHARGIVRAVFVADEWLASSDPVFSGFPAPEKKKSYGFVGRPAPRIAWKAWVGRRVPDKYRSVRAGRIGYANI